MFTISLITWQNNRISFVPTAGSPRGRKGIRTARCAVFDHAAVSVMDTTTNITNWYTTQFPIHVPVTLPARIAGPFNFNMLTGTRTTLINRQVPRQSGIAINTSLTAWTTRGQFVTGSINRPLRPGENNCFAMLNHTFKRGGGGSGGDNPDLIAPPWLFSGSRTLTEVRTGAQAPPPGAVVTITGSLGTDTMEQHRTVSGGNIFYSPNTYNVGALIQAIRNGNW